MENTWSVDLKLQSGIRVNHSTSTTTYSFIHSFIHSFILHFIHLFIHSLIHSFILPTILSYLQWHPLFHFKTHSVSVNIPIQPFNHSFISFVLFLTIHQPITSFTLKSFYSLNFWTEMNSWTRIQKISSNAWKKEFKMNFNSVGFF